MTPTTVRFALLPATAVLFAYLELGGNLFAYRLLERRTLWSVSGTLVFSVTYAIVAAFVARRLLLDVSLLMVNYGFGFAVVAMVLKLEWGKLPELTGQLLRSNRGLWGILVLALVGFAWSAVVVARSPAITAPP